MSGPTHLLLASGYADAGEPGIKGFYLLESGALVPAGALSGVQSPSFLAAHPQGAIYVTSETDDGAVAARRLRPHPGQADDLGMQPSGGAWPCHLAFDPGGQWLAVANYGSGSARLYPRLPDGSLGAPGPLAQHRGSGPNADRQEGPHAHATIFSPDGRYAIVADLGIDQLVIYTHAAGALIPHGAGVIHPGAGPRHMAWHPGGTTLYVANELDSTVSVLRFDPQSGILEEQAHLSTLPADAPESYVADIHLDAAAERLYVSNRGHNSIAIFHVAPDGSLSPLAIRSCGGVWPRNFALSPDGRHMVVANQHSNQLAILPILAGPEALGEPVAHADLKGAACAIFVPATIGWFL